MSVSNILKKLNSRNTRLIPQLPKLNKKIKFASILIAFIFLSVLGRQILAEETLNIDKSAAIEKFKTKQSAIDKGNNQEAWMNESIMSNAMALNVAMAGTIPDSVLAGKIDNWTPGGMIGFTNNAIAALYTPPASGVQYIADTFNNFLGKPAYASTGYEGLKGIQNVWKAFRNAVYVLFSVVFILIGIAIMLRVKISQQAVISIQSAIPSLVTGLVLVTFSYAIAGLLIDLSYLFSGLVLAILFSTKGGLDAQLFAGGYNPDFQTLVNSGFGTTYLLLFKILPVAVINSISALIGGVIGAFFIGGGGWPGAFIGAIGGFVIIFTIILLTILIQTIKFFIGIAKCYIALLFRIIFAPIEIGMGVIPNSKMNFSSWIWSVIANLAVFPCSIIFIVLVNFLLENVDGGLWHPPMMGISLILKACVGIAAFFLLAQLPSKIPELVFSIKPSGWEKAIGEGFGSIGSSGLAKFGKGLASDEVDYQARTRIVYPLVDKTEKAKELREKLKALDYRNKNPTGKN